MRDFIIGALVTVVLVLGAVVAYQQFTIEVMLDTELATLQNFVNLSKDIQDLRREVGKEARSHENLERQMDIVTAASRSGWRKAERMIRSGVFEVEVP